MTWYSSSNLPFPLVFSRRWEVGPLNWFNLPQTSALKDKVNLPNRGALGPPLLPAAAPHPPRRPLQEGGLGRELSETDSDRELAASGSGMSAPNDRPVSLGSL